MSNESVQVACPGCDLPVTIGPLNDGERASCPRCGHQLAAGSRQGLEKSLAYAAAALALLVVANAFPFLSFSRAGLGNQMSLPQSALALYQNGSEVLGVLVLGFIILVPAVILLLLFAVLIPLLSRRPVAWLTGAGRAIFLLKPWSMAEVFIIGVIASLVKISGMASVTLGVSFWAYAGFAVLFALSLSTLDRFTVWSAIEALDT